MSGAGAFWLVVGLLVVGTFVGLFIQASREAKIMSTGTQEERAVVIAKQAARESKQQALQHGTARPQIVCPHCQERGHVLCKSIKNKKGISGGKATGAILTGGVSMLATGLSRKEAATEAFCTHCSSTWQF